MNILEITFRAKRQVEQQDRHYRLFVTLIRSDRPKYWKPLCMNCGSAVIELQNLDILDITDFYDPQNVSNTALGRSCKGTTPDGLPCGYKYFFHVS
jgi:hypothetical protein